MSDKKFTAAEIYGMTETRDRLKEADLRQALLQIRDNQDFIIPQMQKRLYNAAGRDGSPYYPLKMSLTFNQIADYNASPESRITGPIRLQHTDIAYHQIFMNIQSLMNYHQILMSCGIEDRDVFGEDGRTYESDFRADFTKAVVIFSHDLERSLNGVTLGSDNILEMQSRQWPADPNPDMRWSPPTPGAP